MKIEKMTIPSMSKSTHLRARPDFPDVIDLPELQRLYDFECSLVLAMIVIPSLS